MHPRPIPQFQPRFIHGRPLIPAARAGTGRGMLPGRPSTRGMRPSSLGFKEPCHIAPICTSTPSCPQPLTGAADLSSTRPWRLPSSARACHGRPSPAPADAATQPMLHALLPRSSDRLARDDTIDPDVCFKVEEISIRQLVPSLATAAGGSTSWHLGGRGPWPARSTIAPAGIVPCEVCPSTASSLKF